MSISSVNKCVLTIYLHLTYKDIFVFMSFPFHLFDIQNADAYSSISTNEEIYKLNSVQIWHRTVVDAAQRPNTYIVQGFRNGYWYELQQFTPTYSTAQIITLELNTQPTALFYSGFKLIGLRGSNEFITFVEIEWNVSYETPALFIDGLYYKDANGEIYSSSSGGS